MTGTIAKATAIGGLPVPVAAIVLPPPAGRCFTGLESRNPNGLHLISLACARTRGYDTFWMAEHHSQPEGTELIPNVLMTAMHLCGVTKNIRIGCSWRSAIL